jgi:hypothetical protein
MPRPSPEPASIRWVDEAGAPVSCIEKLKMLEQALAELRQVAQDTFEDAILMGCAEAQTRAVLLAIIEGIENPYRKAP